LAVAEGEWNEDGPWLPIEFSRIASDGRLTLVIDPDFDQVRVYWKIMNIGDLNAARKNLQQREGAETIEEIGFVNADDQTFCIRDDIAHLKRKIVDWTKSQNLNAVIWTALKPKFKEKTGKEFTEVNVLEYLKGLTGETYKRAKEYILKTPPNTQTRFRLTLENLYK